MNYEALVAEINTLLETMRKETPESENYETHVKRLGELQQMAIKWREMELAEAEQSAEEALKKRELITQEEDIRQRSNNSKREVRAEYGKTILSGVFTLGAILMTQFIEENDIIRTKGWGFISGLIRKI